MDKLINKYFDNLAQLSRMNKVTDSNGENINFMESVELFIKKSIEVNNIGNKLMFIGNGGSSTIASHMAEDFSKAANIRAMSFNDSAFITCLANDYGYEYIFSKQIELFAKDGDILVAISSSGESPNIINAVKIAKKIGCWVLTLSGFKQGNSLSNLGDLNIYVPSDQYGLVEISHLTICHGALDIALGWTDNKKNDLKVAV